MTRAQLALIGLTLGAPARITDGGERLRCGVGGLVAGGLLWIDLTLRSIGR